MNWLSDFIRPKIRSLVGPQKDVPDNLWSRCPSCEGMLFHRDLAEQMNVCYHCGYHMKWSVDDRLANTFDDGKYETIAVPKVPVDPLKFKDRKKYSDRLRESQSKTGKQDAIVVAAGTIEGQPAVIAAFDFDFMGGSMGMAVGEGIVKAAEVAVKRGSALIVVPSSGGARMQEGALSLMQMPRTIIAVNRVQDAGLPYFVLLTNPTTGGVSASFAMVGDIHIAEPGATIGFAGKRVIQETIREDLPDGFQTAEYLKEHGMVDLVIKRSEMKEKLGQLISLLTVAYDDSGNNGTGKKDKSASSNAKGAGKSGRKGGNATKAAATAKVVKMERKPASKPQSPSKEAGKTEVSDETAVASAPKKAASGKA